MFQFHPPMMSKKEVIKLNSFFGSMLDNGVIIKKEKKSDKSNMGSIK